MAMESAVNERPTREIALSEPGTGVAPFVSLDELVADVYSDLLFFDEAVEKFRQKLLPRRIQCGLKLLELRRRVEAGEAGNIGWWAWYQTKFTRSRRDAERLLEFASQEDPQAAYEIAKAKHAADTRAYRERQRQVSDSRESEEPPLKVSAHRTPKTKGGGAQPVDVELTPPPIQQELIEEGLALYWRMNPPTRRRYFVELKKVHRD
jgi:hypothetical protein